MDRGSLSYHEGGGGEGRPYQPTYEAMHQGVAGYTCSCMLSTSYLSSVVILMSHKDIETKKRRDKEN